MFSPGSHTISIGAWLEAAQAVWLRTGDEKTLRRALLDLLRYLDQAENLPEVRKMLAPHASTLEPTLLELLKHNDIRARVEALKIGMAYLWGKLQLRSSSGPRRTAIARLNLPLGFSSSRTQISAENEVCG